MAGRQRMGRNSMRLLRLLAAVAVTATTTIAGLAPAVDAAAKLCNGTPQSAGGGWLAFKPPGINPTMVTAVPYAPDRLYASEGTQLWRTDDGGCNWSQATLPSLPAVSVAGVSAGSLTVTINAISAPSSASATGYVYLAVQAGASSLLTQVSKPYVFVSTDAGRTWTAQNSNFPSVGAVTDVAASADAPTVAYAAVTDTTGQSSGLYRTNDTGLTWTRMSGQVPNQGTLKVNPVVSNQLFGVFSDGLERSTDGGRSFTPLSNTDPTAKYDVQPGAGYIQMVQGFGDKNVFERSTNGGNSWTKYPSVIAPNRVATAPLTNTVVIGNGQVLLLEQSKGASYSISPVNPAIGIPDHVAISAPVAGGLSITGLVSGSNGGSNFVVRLIYNVLTNKVIQQHLTPIQLLPNIGVKQFPSTLYPFTNTVQLAAGQTEDVPYRLLLPRTPSPVDLMFLVDTTYSTDRTLDGVRQDLATVVKELATSGLDAQFGVAEFRDYSTNDLGGGETGDFPYALRRAIGPANDSLRAALNSLHSAGGGDEPESQLTALDQSASGAGQWITDVDGRHVHIVRTGQQAGYRSDALKLAIMTTDAPFHKEREYPTPRWSSVVADMNAAGVHQIGLAVQTVDTNGHVLGYDSKNDETLMARDTGAISPTGGVDCNGDGTTDIAAGNPLVCLIEQATSQSNSGGVGGGLQLPINSKPAALHLANAIVDLATNLPDLQHVTIKSSGGPKGTPPKVIRPGTTPVVNLHTDNTLGYTVRFTCPQAPAPQTYNVRLDAMAGIRSVTSATTLLQCGPSARPAPILPAVAVAAVAAAPGGPPNPPAQGNANPNPNPALNPNAGFAQQEDQEKQLAFAGADQGEALGETTEELAMSRRGPSTAEEGMMLGAAGLMTAAAGYAVRRRWQSSSAYNRI
jgi:hypothetical protein